MGHLLDPTQLIYQEDCFICLRDAAEKHAWKAIEAADVRWRYQKSLDALKGSLFKGRCEHRDLFKGILKGKLIIHEWNMEEIA